MASFAASGTTQPTTTETTGTCKTGMIWDADTKKCVAPTESFLDDDDLFDAVREYAHAGKIEAAQTVLAAMRDQSEDRVLTYWGYTHRKSGDLELGLAYYRKALRQNPDNLLARSYMGQAFVEVGHPDAARAATFADPVPWRTPEPGRNSHSHWR